MADRAPLLEYEEGPAVTFSPWDGSSPAPGNGAGSAASPRGAADSWNPGSDPERDVAAAPGAQQQEEEEQVVAVFVVTFDTRA
eukprot:g29298.t1